MSHPFPAPPTPSPVANPTGEGALSWSHLHVWRPLIIQFVRLLFLVLGPIRTFGKEKVPREGGLLILCNHIADLDPPVVQAACPRVIRFMAKSDLFSIPVLGPFMRWGGAFPVKRGEPDRNALKKAAELAKAGEAVCIFPEGQLSETGELQELKPGVALIVRMAGAPVICCGIRNTNRIMPYGKLIPRPSLRFTDVRWGEPRTFDKHATVDEVMGWVEGELRSLTTKCQMPNAN